MEYLLPIFTGNITMLSFLVSFTLEGTGYTAIGTHFVFTMNLIGTAFSGSSSESHFLRAVAYKCGS